MRRSTDRILTTHTGSLPRPESLTRLFVRRALGESVDPKEITAAGLDAVRAIVPKQAQAGIDVGNNGEQQRDSFFLYLKERLTGLGGTWQRPSRADVDRYPVFKKRWLQQTSSQARVSPNEGLPMAIGDVRYKDPAAIETECRDFKDVLALTPNIFVESFMNAPSPGIVAAAIKNEHYDTLQGYLQALGEALRVEYEAIVKAGFLLQLDCPDLAMARHTGFQDLTESEFLKRAEHQVEVMNDAVRNIPADSMRMHVCWGNYEGPHDYDIALDKVIGIILKARPAAILFEASNPRHAHEWIVWKNTRIPDEKILIPGLLTSTSNYVEHPELVAQRICQFAEIVGRERVIAGTDCGFGTFAGIGKMDAGISFKKLTALVEGARLASDRLWPA